MADEPSGDHQPVKKNWWGRRSLLTKILIVLVALAIVGAAISGGGDDSADSTANNNSTEAAEEATDEPTEKPAEEPEEEDNTGPIVKGTWDGECNQFSAGDLSACEALKVSKVTCQWVEDKVVMKATFVNGLAAHVTVHVEPGYDLKNAGAHGEGLTNVEDVGIDANATRVWEVELDPAGVEDTQPAITKCRPKLDVLQGVELG